MGVIRTEYSIGDLVYLKLREDKEKAYITGISVRPAGVAYYLSWGDATESFHYDFEITKEYVPNYAGD